MDYKLLALVGNLGWIEMGMDLGLSNGYCHASRLSSLGLGNQEMQLNFQSTTATTLPFACHLNIYIRFHLIAPSVRKSQALKPAQIQTDIIRNVFSAQFPDQEFQVRLMTTEGDMKQL